MGDDASAAKLVKLHFVFTWVLAVVVALNWLALPQYSESILGWSIYTLVVTALMPLIRYKLQGHRFGSRPFRMTRLLLMSMTGTVVGTSWSGLVALLFPQVSDFQSPGPTGITLAVAITFLFVIVQTILEKQIQEMPDPQTPENTYGGAVRSTLLNSLWSTLGYFWNSVWNRFLTKMQRASRPHPRPRLGLLGNIGNMTLQGDFDAAGPARDGPLHRFKTLQDEMNGRPENMDSNGPGYRLLLVKAVLTLLAGILLLCCLPEPSERYGSHRRRALIALKMMAIIITSYAVTDAGFYFGTKLVADRTGSAALGLAVSFLYAGLVTLFVTYIAERSTWHPERVFPNRLQTLGAWLVCYAWWYSWQEVLYQIQGFGLWQLGMNSVLEQSLQVAIAISGALCFTLLLSLALVSAAQLGCCALPPIAAVLPQLKQASMRNCNFPEFSACLGLPVDERLHGIQLGSDQPASADAD
ncbi:unnamed protein product [Symbiodinium sp. CCMP2592]|nr:unnamed protein product [Symbiodinium sp. CCMP2592]